MLTVVIVIVAIFVVIIPGFGVRQNRVWISTPPLTRGVTLGKTLGLPEEPFLVRKTGRVVLPVTAAEVIQSHT